MLTSPYEWKILEWDFKLQTNKQTNKRKMDEKETIKNQVKRVFPRIRPISFFFLCPRCTEWHGITYWAFLTRKSPYTKHMFMSYWVAWYIRTLVIYFPTYIVRFLNCNSIPDISDILSFKTSWKISCIASFFSWLHLISLVDLGTLSFLLPQRRA